MEGQKSKQDFRFLEEIIANTAGIDSADSSKAHDQSQDIRAYTQQVKQQLSALEEECALDFVGLNESAFQLYRDINQSEQILEKIAGVVDSFQGELERISDDVKTLQDRSEKYHVQLKNRKGVSGFLIKYLDNTLLTKDLVEALCNQDIDADLADYLEKVEKLNEMIYYCSNPPQTISQNSQSLQVVKPEVDKLKHKVCSRSYKFILAKMNNLRKPNTNFQIYQESILLKYKGLMSFLKIHNNDVFKEVCDKYCEIMNILYSSKLHQYFKESWNLVYHRITKPDILFASENEDPKQAGLNAKTFEQCFTQFQSYSKMARGAKKEGEHLAKGQIGQLELDATPLTRQIFMYDVEDRLRIFEEKKPAYPQHHDISVDMPFSARNLDESHRKGDSDDQIETGHNPMELASFLPTNMPLFVEDPIVAHIAQTKGQKFLVEEIFRSQMKLISDTIAKEFLFILEFFDVQITNKTQLTYMFNLIFRQIISKYYVDKLKKVCDTSLFDLYSCLIMIQINEECKKQMQQVYRISVFDAVLEKLSIYVLWPRFSQIFDMHLNNIKRCDSTVFKLYNQPNLHSASTVRCFMFLSGLFRLQEVIQLGEQNNMLRQRFMMLLNETVAFVERMAKTHFVPVKDQEVYLANNLDFMVQTLEQYQLKKVKNDYSDLSIRLDKVQVRLIEIYLMDGFADLVKVSSQFSGDEANLSGDVEQKELTNEAAKGFNPAELEKIGKDFMKTYKQKVEQVMRDVKSSLGNAGKQTAMPASGKSGKNIKKDVVQKMIRILMLHFTTFIDILKVGQFQQPFLKSLVQNSQMANQVLIDLKNFSQQAAVMYSQ